MIFIVAVCLSVRLADGVWAVVFVAWLFFLSIFDVVVV